MDRKFELQTAEFDAVAALVKCWRSQPAIVDDDYPNWREEYEVYIRRLLHAAKANGKQL